MIEFAVAPATGPVVTWGIDFWQKVLISGLGTLGALLIGAGLFYLKRWHDRRDEDERLRRERQESLKQRLQLLTQQLRDEEVDEGYIQSGVHSRSIAATQLLEVALVIEDKALRSFAYSYSRWLRLILNQHKELQKLTQDPPAREEAIDVLARSIAHERWYGRVTTEASLELTRYLHNGGPFDMTVFDPPSPDTAHKGRDGPVAENSPDPPEDGSGGS